jgi:hypothetical protein
LEPVATADVFQLADGDVVGALMPAHRYEYFLLFRWAFPTG